MSELTEQLRNARGKRYYDILKQILAEIGPQIAEDARTIKDQNGGKLTLFNVGQLAVKYDLNFKATVEWLEESRVLKTGAYERLKDAGVKAREVLTAVPQGDAKGLCGCGRR